MESGNDYVIQVKGNQKGLLKSITKLAEEQPPLDTFTSYDKTRGREENRYVYLYKYEQGLADKDWIGLKRIIKVINKGKRKGKDYYEVHFYISSHGSSSAKFFGMGIRKHWSVENRLHWVKDVIQNEDKSRIKDGQLVSNLSLIKSTVISIFRMNGYPSLTRAIERYCNKIHECTQLMEIKNI